VRVGHDQARKVDALAHEAGLKRSEFLRLLIARVTDGDLPPALLSAGADLRRARTVVE
jgi:hypothetical protein